jgi:pimeloyl-ACP methyl ester carboxylesterase
MLVRMLISNSVSLPQGTIEYHDSDPGGRPDAVVFVHGLLVDGSLWDGVVERMQARHRCIVLELPLGCHRVPLADGAERTPAGVAALVADVLEALDLDGVTLVGNDTGGALCQWVAANRPERLARLVLTPCDSYDEFLPAIFRPLQWAARVPGGLRLGIAPLRIRRLRRLPIAFGRLVKKPVPDDLGDRWVNAFLADRRVRHDAVAFTAAISTSFTNEVAAKLPAFTKPALLIWAPENRVFSTANCDRLAAALPDSRVEHVDDAYAFVPLDQPERTAELIDAFVP